MVSLESLHAKRAAIIYNPVARGLARRQHLLQRTTAVLQRQGVEAKTVATTGPGSATAQVRRLIADGFDLILAAGGDGTINEVANGMLNSDVPLGILPGGTANVLARELRIPIHLERAAAQLLHYCPRRVAAGSLQIEGYSRRLFLCMAGAGLDAEIVSRLNLDLKAAAGKLAYYAGGFAQAFRPLREFEVLVDGTSYPASFALISRVRNYGGDLEIVRGASLLRDDFEIALFRGTVSFRYLIYLAGVTLRLADKMPGVTMLHGRSVQCNPVNGGPVYVQVDGELAGTLPLAAQILPNALTVLIPAESIAREQQYTAAACA